MIFPDLFSSGCSGIFIPGPRSGHIIWCCLGVCLYSHPSDHFLFLAKWMTRCTALSSAYWKIFSFQCLSRSYLNVIVRQLHIFRLSSQLIHNLTWAFLSSSANLMETSKVAVGSSPGFSCVEVSTKRCSLLMSSTIDAWSQLYLFHLWLTH